MNAAPLEILLAPGELKVEAIPGEPFRFHVHSSRSDEPPYLCDLEARFPLGRCTCSDYSCRKWPAFKQTLYPIRCKHLRSAFMFYALQHIRSSSSNLKGEGE